MTTAVAIAVILRHHRLHHHLHRHWYHHTLFHLCQLWAQKPGSKANKSKKGLPPENGTIERGHLAIGAIAVAVVINDKRETTEGDITPKRRLFAAIVHGSMR